jgi:hypothetical protein
VVSTDPAHSLSDAFEQDLRGGLPVPITSPMGERRGRWMRECACSCLQLRTAQVKRAQTPAAQMPAAQAPALMRPFPPHPTNLAAAAAAAPAAGEIPLWGMQLELEQARQELRAINEGSGGERRALAPGTRHWGRRIAHTRPAAWPSSMHRATRTGPGGPAAPRPSNPAANPSAAPPPHHHHHHHHQKLPTPASPAAEELNQFLDGLGLGVISSQLRDLNLGELLDTPPPGVDEAVAISKVGAAAGGGGAGCGVAVLGGMGGRCGRQPGAARPDGLCVGRRSCGGSTAPAR